MNDETLVWATAAVKDSPEQAAWLLASRTEETDRLRRTLDAIRALSQNLDIALSGNRSAVEFALGRKIED